MPRLDSKIVAALSIIAIESVLSEPDLESAEDPMRKTALAVAFILILVGLLNISCSTVSDLTAGGCGDGIIQVGEQCDDGNNTSGDGCSSSCSNEGSQAPPGSPMASPEQPAGSSLSKGSGA